MGQAGTLLRKALNLPEASPGAPVQRRAAEPTGSTGSTGSTMAEAAVEAPAAATPEGVGAASVVTGSGSAVPWETEDETSGAVWLRRVMRGLLVAVLALAAFTGVRQWVAPRTETVTAPPSAVDRFPREQAGAVAARFAQSYLSWDQEAPDARRQAMALDLFGGATGDLGWDGKGRQSAGSATPAGVVVDGDGTRARVTVLALVTPFTRPADAAAAPGAAGWTPGTPAWRAVEVPVVVTPTRVVVTGEPGLVALPAPGGVTAGNEPPEDSVLGRETQRYAQSFFTAYAAGVDVDALIAPGAAVANLGGAVTLDRLSSWRVQTGDLDERQAHAVVLWRHAGGGAVIEQTYTVRLTRVTGAGGDNWQVASLHGGN